MKYRWFLIVMMILSAFVVYGGGKSEKKAAEEPAAPELPEDALASVNGTFIATSDFDREFAREKETILMQGGQITEEIEADLRKQIIDSMIERVLLLQESKREGLEVDPADVQMEFDQYKAGFQDEESFQLALEDQGYSQEQLMTQIEEYLFITQYINDRVYASIVVAEEDVQAFYSENPDYFTEPEQIKARHILLTFGGEDQPSREETLALAETIRQDLLEGADFAELASLHSECPSSAQGGDLGYFGKGQMVPEFEDAAFSLPVGDISSVVETSYGFHIIEVTDKTEAALVPVESVYSMIESYLKQEQTISRIDELLTDLRDQSTIVIR